MAPPDRLHLLELNVLYQICRIIGDILSLDQALESILAILSNSLSMERATVTLKDEQTGLLAIRASHGLHPEEKNRGVYQPREGVTGRIFQTAQPFVVPDIGKEPLFLNKTQARTVSKESLAFIGVPILLNSETIGVLSVDRVFDREVAYEEDIRFLTIVAMLIAQFVHINQEVDRRQANLRKENRFLRKEISKKYNHYFTVGVSPAMRTLNEMVRKVAPSKASVLLLGESGTGKTLTARIIHELSGRSRGPFVKINCAALPENLLESELFGFEKGAFSGADAPKPGLFEEAESGTVFLDEIGELPLSIQAKLLQFLQDKELQRLGSNRSRSVDVRVITATNIDLAEAVSNGAFRADLYYRLNVFPMAIPPLRERKEDIPLLCDYFLKKISAEYSYGLRFDHDCLQILQEYSWPGNIRELENLIERLAIIVDGRVFKSKDLPAYIFNISRNLPNQTRTEPSTMEKLERETILKALERNHWVQSNAAKDLGMSLRQIGYRLKKYGLTGMVKNERLRNAE